jgi:hypothetical protein
LPQCIEAAKQLYDLRERYKDASMLITSIYSESMVIAASLSHVQGLLQRNALQSRPELYDTFDKALTGCWVVYQCLEEEVRSLAQKAHDDDLGFRDKTKFLWKEDTFKELLQQIRGQQTGLTLLVQGLQMESITDIHKLVEDNSAKLDQVVQRSITLRKQHPNIKVLDSVFDESFRADTLVDDFSIFHSAEFAFDDEIVNSRAYRSALARVATLQNEREEPARKIIEGDLIDLDTVVDKDAVREQEVAGAAADFQSMNLDSVDVTAPGTQNTSLPAEREEEPEAQAELLDALEKSMLPYMPPIQSPGLEHTTTGNSLSSEISGARLQETRSTSVGDLVAGGLKSETASSSISEHPALDEKPPPLPPRRPTQPPPSEEESKPPKGLKTTPSWENIFSLLTSPTFSSEASGSSSLGLTDPSTEDVITEDGVVPKPLSVSHKVSTNILQQVRSYGDDLLRTSSTQAIAMHNVWSSLLLEEEEFINRMSKFRTLFYDAIIKNWPILERHLEIILIGERIASLHRRYVFEAVQDQLSRNSSITCNPSVFNIFIEKAHKLYQEYSQHLPHAQNALRLTQSMDKKFTPFVLKLGLGEHYSGKSWEDYLHLPIARLNNYIDKLESLSALSKEIGIHAASKHEVRLRKALALIRKLEHHCAKLNEMSTKQEELQSLHRKIHTLDANLLAMLKLSDSHRRIVYQGPLAIKVKGHGAWQPVHAVLLDNYLFWGNTKPPKAGAQQKRKHEDIWLLQPVSSSLSSSHEICQSYTLS